MRRVLGGFAALVLVAIAAFYFLFDVNQFRGTIQSQLEKTIHRKVTLGSMSLQLFPLAVAIDQVAVADDPAFSAKPFLAARRLAVSANLLALLQGRVEVRNVRIDDPVIEVIRNASGKWNYQSLGATENSQGGSPFSLAELRVDNGTIGVTRSGARSEYRNIDLLIRDYAENKPFSLEAFAHLPDKLTLEASTRASYLKDAQTLRVESLQARLGGLKITGSGTVSTAPGGTLDFQVKTDDASIAEAAGAAAKLGAAFSPDMKVSGLVDSDLRISGTVDKPVFSGKFVASKLEMSRSAWKLPVKIPEISLALTPDSIRSNRFTALCGNTKADASFSLLQYNHPDAVVSAQIGVNQGSVQELLQIAGAYGLSTAAVMTGTGQVTVNAALSGRLKDEASWTYSGSGVLRDATLQSPALTKPIQVRNAKLRFEHTGVTVEDLNAGIGETNLTGSVSVRRFSAPEVKFNAAANQISITDLQNLVKPGESKTQSPGPLNRISGNGSISIGTLTYEAVTLRNVKAQCSLDRGVIRLDPLTADLFGGRYAGAITADARGVETKVTTQSKIEQVSADELLSSTTSLKQFLLGKLAASANLSFVSRPGENLARTLNGSLQMEMKDGKLKGVNLVNELGRIAKALGAAKAVEPVTNILKFSAGVDIRDGVATTNDLKMDFAGGTLAAAGQIGLVDQKLKMTMLPVLSKQFSDQLGGNSVAGILSTVLANQRGELVIPVIVGGTTSQPTFMPDAARFAQIQAQNLIPSLVDVGKSGGVKGILDSIVGGKAASSAQQQTQPKQQETQPKPQSKPSLLDLLKKR